MKLTYTSLACPDWTIEEGRRSGGSAMGTRPSNGDWRTVLLLSLTRLLNYVADCARCPIRAWH